MSNFYLFNTSCNKVCGSEFNLSPCESNNGVISQKPWTRFQQTCLSNSVSDLNMRRKAEVLKYKNNSFTLTKKQRYSLASRNLLTKKKSWANQKQGYITNPNTSNLIPTGFFQNNFDNSQNLSWKGLFACCVSDKLVPNIPNINPDDNNFGSCNIKTNKKYLTTQSNVPGKPIELKLDPTIPLTRYTPVRRVYKSGNTKWPQFGWSPGSDGFPVGKKGKK